MKLELCVCPVDLKFVLQMLKYIYPISLQGAKL